MEVRSTAGYVNSYPPRMSEDFAGLIYRGSGYHSSMPILRRHPGVQEALRTLLKHDINLLLPIHISKHKINYRESEVSTGLLMKV